MKNKVSSAFGFCREKSGKDQVLLMRIPCIVFHPAHQVCEPPPLVRKIYAWGERIKNKLAAQTILLHWTEHFVTQAKFRAEFGKWI